MLNISQAQFFKIYLPLTLSLLMLHIDDSSPILDMINLFCIITLALSDTPEKLIKSRKFLKMKRFIPMNQQGVPKNCSHVVGIG